MKQLKGSKVLRPTTTSAQRDYFNQLVEKYGCPLEAMFQIGSSDSVTSELRLRAFSEAAQYGMTKLRAVEMTGPDGGPLEVKLALVGKLTNALDALTKAQDAMDALDPSEPAEFVEATDEDASKTDVEAP